MNIPFCVGMMGAGRIAQGFDGPDDNNVLTLAHALRLSEGFSLGGFYDIDPQRAAAAEKTWGVSPSPRERQAWLAKNWDVVFIATPNQQHAADIQDVLEHVPKAIMIEKPVAVDQAQAAKLLREAANKGIAVLVDFPRRYHSGFAEVAALIGDGRMGNPLAATFVYSGKAENSAVHMLDLLHGWWGGWTANLLHRSDNTTTVAFSRDAASFEGTFTTLSTQNYYVWEMSIFCAHGKVELSGSPEILDISLTGPHPLYPAFDVLLLHARYEMEAEMLLPRLVATLHSVLTNSAVAAAQCSREIECQNFVGDVLSLLQDVPLEKITAVK